MIFEWDLNKEISNVRKHGFSFSEAIDTFKDPLGFVLEDKKHSKLEKRFYWVGKSSKGAVLTTRFTCREDIIRIFGCANWRDFREYYYEKESSWNIHV